VRRNRGSVRHVWFRRHATRRAGAEKIGQYGARARKSQRQATKHLTVSDFPSVYAKMRRSRLLELIERRFGFVLAFCDRAASAWAQTRDTLGATYITRRALCGATKGTRCNTARDRETVSEFQPPQPGRQADEARRFRRKVAGRLCGIPRTTLPVPSQGKSFTG